MIVVLEEGEAIAELERGGLVCRCGGRLRPWGHSAARVVRHRGGCESRRRWRRGRCSDCGATHVLAAGVLPRRRDELTTIGAALVQASGGVGHRPIAASLGVPAATVRNWLRRARAGAGSLAATTMAWAHRLDRDLGPTRPGPSPLADAVTAFGIAAAAVRRGLGITSEPWRIVASLTGARMLAAPSG